MAPHRTRERGHVAQVTSHTRGDEANGQASLGASLVTVFDTSDFTEDGGTARYLDAAGATQVLTYIGRDDDLGVVISDAGSVMPGFFIGGPPTAIPDGARIETLPIHTDRYAQIVEQDLEGEVAVARVKQSQKHKIAPGPRDDTAGEGEPVHFVHDGDEWHLDDMMGGETTIEDSLVVLGTVSAPAETGWRTVTGDPAFPFKYVFTEDDGTDSLMPFAVGDNGNVFTTGLVFGTASALGEDDTLTLPVWGGVPPVKVQSKIVTSLGGSSITGALRVAATAGNTAIAVVTLGSTTGAVPTVATPAGWTLAVAQNGSYVSTFIFFRDAAATTNSTTWNFSNADSAGVVMQEWHGLQAAATALDRTASISLLGPVTVNTGTTLKTRQAVEVCIGSLATNGAGWYQVPVGGFVTSDLIPGPATEIVSRVTFKAATQQASDSFGLIPAVGPYSVGAIATFRAASVGVAPAAPDPQTIVEYARSKQGLTTGLYIQDESGYEREVGLGGVYAILAEQSLAAGGVAGTNETEWGHHDLPGGLLTRGTVLRVSMTAVGDSSGAPPAFTLRFRIGSTAGGMASAAVMSAWTFTPAAGKAAAALWWEGLVTVRGPDGASAVFQSSRRSIDAYVSAANVAVGVDATPPTLDNTVPLSVWVTGQWAAATAGNSLKAEQLVLEIVKGA